MSGVYFNKENSKPSQVIFHLFHFWKTHVLTYILSSGKSRNFGGLWQIGKHDKKIKSVTISTFLHPFAMRWWDQMPWSSFFWMLSFKPVFSLSSFTFIKMLFGSSLLSVIRVVSSAYLRLLIFLLEILIPACASSSPAFWMMYSAFKLNKQGDDIQPWRTPFPIWNQSIVLCLVLTVAS